MRGKIDKDKIRRMVEAGMGCTEIAKELGCSVAYVSVCVKEMSLRHKLRRTWQPSRRTDPELFTKLWAAGASTKFIARYFGVSVPAVHRWATDLGLPGLLTVRHRIATQIINEHAAQSIDMAA